jgi:hypothetical protein
LPSPDRALDGAWNRGFSYKKWPSTIGWFARVDVSRPRACVLWVFWCCFSAAKNQERWQWKPRWQQQCNTSNEDYWIGGMPKSSLIWMKIKKKLWAGRSWIFSAASCFRSLEARFDVDLLRSLKMRQQSLMIL